MANKEGAGILGSRLSCLGDLTGPARHIQKMIKSGVQGPCLRHNKEISLGLKAFVKKVDIILATRRTQGLQAAFSVRLQKWLAVGLTKKASFRHLKFSLA